MKAVLGFLLATSLAACAIPGPREPERYFILDAGVTAPRTGAPVVVAPTTAASFYDTQDIAYSRSPGTRAYYQYNHWTERPQRSIHAQLAARLGGGPAKGGLRLDTNLEEIYHDASEQPGTSRIVVTAELFDPGSSTVLARRSFSGSAPAASYDAPGAVQGFNQALAALIGEIQVWVATEARPKPR